MYLYAYIHMCIYTCICIHICIYICVCVSIYQSIYLSTLMAFHQEIITHQTQIKTLAHLSSQKMPYRKSKRAFFQQQPTFTAWNLPSAKALASGPISAIRILVTSSQELWSAHLEGSLPDSKASCFRMPLELTSDFLRSGGQCQAVELLSPLMLPLL